MLNFSEVPLRALEVEWEEQPLVVDLRKGGRSERAPH
jgi:hypothetical protein